MEVWISQTKLILLTRDGHKSKPEPGLDCLFQRITKLLSVSVFVTPQNTSDTSRWHWVPSTVHVSHLEVKQVCLLYACSTSRQFIGMHTNATLPTITGNSGRKRRGRGLEAFHQGVFVKCRASVTSFPVLSAVLTHQAMTRIFPWWLLAEAWQSLCNCIHKDNHMLSW